jgi:hypothetical protein
VKSRRKFITLVGGAAVTWPEMARAHQTERVQRIGVLANTAANDPVGQARIAAFQQALQQLGWIDGRNVRIEYRWPGGGNAEDTHKYVAPCAARFIVALARFRQSLATWWRLQTVEELRYLVGLANQAPVH